jgi:hypothetical protein
MSRRGGDALRTQTLRQLPHSPASCRPRTGAVESPVTNTSSAPEGVPCASYEVHRRPTGPPAICGTGAGRQDAGQAGDS